MPKTRTFFYKLDDFGVVSILRSGSDRLNQDLHDLSIKGLTDIRNGFDHAWTSKAKPPETIEKCGFIFLAKLEKVMLLLEEKGLLLKPGTGA